MRMIEDGFDPTCEMPLPLVSLGPSGIGGEYQAEVRESSITRMEFVGDAADRGRMRVGDGAWVGEIAIPDRNVRITNAGPGTEVEWLPIPQVVGDAAKKSISAVEGFCMGLGLGLVALTLWAWLV